ncbi:MAG TPA: glycosyltransferase [Anaerolineales bacterium]
MNQFMGKPPSTLSPFQEYFGGAKLRFLLYCHDTYGLGHIRRTLALARHFTRRIPGAEVLIATGSPVAHSFVLPPRVDYVKLPAVTKTNAGGYRARSLDLEFDAIRDLRAAILHETARVYQPDVFLVDHAPQGLKGEALSTLTMLKYTQPECLRVLGLRDIVDAGPVIQKTWREEGVYQTLEDLYDLILVYGSRELFDVAEQYRLPEHMQDRIRYCGYLDRVTEASQAANTRPTAAASRRTVVLTAGGGGDGFPLMRNHLLGLQQLGIIPFASVLLTGPLMEEAERAELHRLAASLPRGSVRIESFLPDPLPLLQSADLVVSMAGYNTVCELLALKQRMLLVPRSVPRKEQLVRASILERNGLAQMLAPEHLTPAALMEGIQQAFEQPRPDERRLAGAGISFGGLGLAGEAILEQLYRRAVLPWSLKRSVEQVAQMGAL